MRHSLKNGREEKVKDALSQRTFAQKQRTQKRPRTLHHMAHQEEEKGSERVMWCLKFEDTE